MKYAIHLGFWCSSVVLLEVLAFVVSLHAPEKLVLPQSGFVRVIEPRLWLVFSGHGAA